MKASAGLAVLFACAVLFQVLTFAQPSPIVGAMLLGVVAVASVPRKSRRNDRLATA